MAQTQSCSVHVHLNSEAKDARCHPANRGLGGNDEMEVKRKSGAKLRNLPLFRGLDVKDHVVDHFLWYYITKFSCNHEKRTVFLSPTTPPKNRALFNIWLTNISLVPASQLLALDNILVAYKFYGKSTHMLVTFVSKNTNYRGEEGTVRKA